MKYHQVKVEQELSKGIAEVFAKSLIELYELESPVTICVSDPLTDHIVQIE